MIQDLLNSPLFIVLLISGIGVILVGVVFLLVPSEVQTRLKGFVDNSPVEPIERVQQRREQIGSFRSWMNDALSILSSDALRIRLASAHWQITDREFVALRIVGTVLAFGLGYVISKSLIGGIGVAIVVNLLPGFFLYRDIDRRRIKFQDQLLDALVLIRGGVQSGYSLLQALDLVRDELPAPASEEFGRVVREVQLGLPLSQAMLNLSGRMDSDDLYLVVTAVIINSQVGGNLSNMLTAVTDTIRARMFLFGEVRALTSYARYAGYFLTFLPFLTGLLIYLLNPGYFDKVPGSLIAQAILGLALVMLIIGNIWIRRIIRIRI